MSVKADPPDTSKIPAADAVGVTVVLITASYRDQEFVRVGYYVNNEYDDAELAEKQPSPAVFERLVRTIASEQPRVTKFKINWDSAASAALAAGVEATTSVAAAAAAGTNSAIQPSTSAAAAGVGDNTQDSEMVDISNLSAAGKNASETGKSQETGSGGGGDLRFDTNKENINENLSQKLVIQ